MKKQIIIFFLITTILACLAGAADTYKSLDLINRANWGKFFNDLFSYLPISQGALHFTPVDAYLLGQVLPAGVPIVIYDYQILENEPPWSPEQIPFLADKLNFSADAERLRQLISTASTEVVVYPSLNKLFILINGAPYAQVRVQTGPEEEYLPALMVTDNQPVTWSQTLALPTEPGIYTFLGTSNYYLSGSYYQESVIPFGAWLIKAKKGWLYNIGDWWYNAPANIADDLDQPQEKRTFAYFDSSTDGLAARWGNNIFGRDILLWSADIGHGYPYMGFSPSELVYEQKMLIKDLVFLLTVPGADDFASCAAQCRDLQSYATPQPAITDPRILKAVGEYQENRLPRNPERRREALGLYYYFLENQLKNDQQRSWYEKIKRAWPFFQQLRENLRKDFELMGVMSQANRQNILDLWLNSRLDLGTALPPKEAKYILPLNFNDFFRPVERPSLFTIRERDEMSQLIKKAISGEAPGLNIQSVNALNNFNFGRLLNDILGNLYRSHGCLHVSPRNSKFLYQLIPIGTPITIYDYLTEASQETTSTIPFLSDLVNFSEDLDKLKATCQVTAEVKVVVYPRSGLWIICLNGQPLAQLSVKGGPKKKRYVVTSRDNKGFPIFEDHLAYPTTPGRYRIFNKVEDYVSNIYPETTAIPMGGLIRKDNNEWLFQNKAGQWRPLPSLIADDLNKPAEAREFTYYNEEINASNEVIGMKWGSQPFGKYAIQISIDGKRPLPELVHTSGDLIMEERQLINDLIIVMAAPYDDLESCIDNDTNFNYYRSCFQFVLDPNKGELIDDKFRANYKLYYNLPLSTREAALLPPDAIVSFKVNGQAVLSKEDKRALIAAGIASIRRNRFIINKEKLEGVRFETYQYIIAIEKYAHHYITLKKYWQELNGLRQAMLSDFNNFVIKDPQLFYSFMRELMLSRIALEKLTQDKALQLFDELTGNKTF